MLQQWRQRGLLKSILGKTTHICCTSCLQTHDDEISHMHMHEQLRGLSLLRCHSFTLPPKTKAHTSFLLTCSICQCLRLHSFQKFTRVFIQVYHLPCVFLSGGCWAWKRFHLFYPSLWDMSDIHERTCVRQTLSMTDLNPSFDLSQWGLFNSIADTYIKCI